MADTAVKPDTPARANGEYGLVFNTMRFSVHDGPGIRTTVFLKGCPLRCWWCHNPESQAARPEVIYFRERCLHCGECVCQCPSHALKLDNDVRVEEALCRHCGTCADACLADARELAGRWMSVEETLAIVERDRVFYEESGGGLTLSGGEPMQQPQFAERLLRACRERGIHTVVDTCGYAAAASFQPVAEHVDLFLFDLKIIDPEKHHKYTGASNELVLHNLRWLAEKGKNVILRVPVIPGYTDSDANLSAISALARQLKLARIDLLPYHRIAMDKYQRMRLEYRLGAIMPPTAAQMKAIGDDFARRGLGVHIGG